MCVCVCVQVLAYACAQAFWTRYKYVIAQPAQFTRSSSSTRICGFGTGRPEKKVSSCQCKSSCGIQTTLLAAPYQKEPPTSLILHHNHSFFTWNVTYSKFLTHCWMLPISESISGHGYSISITCSTEETGSLSWESEKDYSRNSLYTHNYGTTPSQTDTAALVGSPSQPDLVWYGEWMHTAMQSKMIKIPALMCMSLKPFLLKFAVSEASEHAWGVRVTPD